MAKSPTGTVPEDVVHDLWRTACMLRNQPLLFEVPNSSPQIFLSLRNVAELYPLNGLVQSIRPVPSTQQPRMADIRIPRHLIPLDHFISAVNRMADETCRASKSRRLGFGKACNYCRQKKHRCDAVKPQCASCRSRDLDCRYPVRFVEGHG